MNALARSAALLAALAAACGDVEGPAPPPPPLAHPPSVSGASPLAPGCRAGGGGTRFAGTEVEPQVAIHPLNPDHLVAAWQQDRWSTGGAAALVAAVSLDGGATWTATPLPLSWCGGGAAPGGDYERATDPWVSFSPDGAVVHAVGLAFDASTPRNAVVSTRSTDGGLTWEPARALAADADATVALDKPTITADPARAGFVYAIWDRLTGVGGDPAASTGPAWLARSTDGGVTWEAPRVVNDPGPGAQTIASQILALPGGGLVDVFVRIAGTGPSARSDVLAARSADAGATWSDPVVVGALQARGVVDPTTLRPVRAGEVVPSSAVDGAGRIWVAWQDARFSGWVRDGIALASSADGGLTWSAPVQVNAVPEVQAFRPAVAAGDAGIVAVTYVDLRYDRPRDLARTWAAVFRASTRDGGETWAERVEGGPFDLRAAPDAGGSFLGDYSGLVARRDGFEAVFSMSTSALGTGTHVFATGPAPTGAVAAEAGGAGEIAARAPPAEGSRAPRVAPRR